MIFYTSQRKCYTFCNTLIHQLHLLVVLQINILYIHSASFDSYFASLHGCFVYVCGSFDVLIALCGHFELMLHLFWATLCFFLHCFVLHCGSFAVFCIFWQIFLHPYVLVLFLYMVLWQLFLVNLHFVVIYCVHFFLGCFMSLFKCFVLLCLSSWSFVPTFWSFKVV